MQVAGNQHHLARAAAERIRAMALTSTKKHHRGSTAGNPGTACMPVQTLNKMLCKRVFKMQNFVLYNAMTKGYGRLLT